MCYPKKEGGLGLKRVEDWNEATAMKHIWNLFTQAGSLWVAGVHAMLLKGRSFGLSVFLRIALGIGGIN